MSEDLQNLIDQIEDIDRDIFNLEQTIAERRMGLMAEKAAKQDELNDLIGKQAKAELDGKAYGCGTVNIETPLHKVKVTVSKKVKWNEEMLGIIKQQIVDAGKNPKEYIKEKLSVSETAYKCFPDDVQKVFQPARSVEPSTPKITIERKA